MTDAEDTVWNPYLVHVMLSIKVDAVSASEAQNIAEHLVQSAVDTAGEVDSEGNRTLTIHHNGGRFDGEVTEVTALECCRMHRDAVSPAAVSIEDHAEQERAGGQPDQQ